MEDNFSSKKIKENIELNNGDKDNNGMVKLKSDCLIAFKKKRADRTLMQIKIIPGNIYGIIFKLKLSTLIQTIKKSSCATVKVRSNVFEFILFNVNFLAKSNAAQKNADIIQIKIGI